MITSANSILSWSVEAMNTGCRGPKYRVPPFLLMSESIALPRMS